MKLIYGDIYKGKPQPNELKQMMFNYLARIEKENRGYEIWECQTCGKRFTADEELVCCEDRHIVHKYMDVPAGDLLRPSKYGFCAFSGISSDRLKRMTNAEEYHEVMDWFFDVLQADLEQILLNPGSRNIGGAKFVAVNNYGWKDKTETEHTGTQAVTFVNNIPQTNTEVDDINE